MQESSEVQDLFGLSEDEELLERFGCSLVQTMECRHNPFSKPQQVMGRRACHSSKVEIPMCVPCTLP